MSKWNYFKRVRPILQTNMVECGAACLAMICEYHRLPYALEDCIEYIRPSSQGTKASDIAKVARQFGFEVNAFTADPEVLNRFPLPAIIHWGFNHFVILEKYTANYIIVVDPAKGRRSISSKEFDKKFTGVVLTFEPKVFKNKNILKKEKSWKTYWRLIRDIPNLKVIIGQILLASLALQIYGLALPLFTKIIIDEIIPYQLFDLTTIIAAGIIVFIIADALISYLRMALLIHLQTKLDRYMLPGLFWHLLLLPYQFFRLRTSGDLIARLASNSAVRELITGQMVSTVLDSGLVIVYLSILLWQAPLFGVVTLLVGLLQIALIWGTNYRAKSLLQEKLVTDSDLQASQIEILRGIATLKASGAENNAYEQWKRLFFNQLNSTVNKDHFFAVIKAIKGTIEKLAPLLLLWLGIIYVLSYGMSLGMMLALNALAIAFLRPLTSLASTGQKLQEGLAHLDRVMKIIEAEPEQPKEDKNSNLQRPIITGVIQIKGVNFRYDKNGPLILKDISLQIKAGQKVAIVGATGSGKSTLGMLLLGLCKPESGQIIYDATSLADFDLQHLRNQFGIVLQEPFLFSGSIRQNVAFTNTDLSLSQVIQACKKAEMHTEILTMPMNYDSIIAEGGSSLSGGQRQRLAIARAIANEPKILLLDEATSHLDIQTEYRIEEHLSTLGCTRIVIAHRLSTVYDADLILVIEDGEIKERGTHRELMLLGGNYCNLVQRQVDFQKIE